MARVVSIQAKIYVIVCRDVGGILTGVSNVLTQAQMAMAIIARVMAVKSVRSRLYFLIPVVTSAQKSVMPRCLAVVGLGRPRRALTASRSAAKRGQKIL